MNGEQTNGNVMQPYKLVKDVRSGYETMHGVMNGDIDNPESLSNDDGAKRRGVATGAQFSLSKLSLRRIINPI
jgi:hypothetical protein